jgi:hypothetical protein
MTHGGGPGVLRIRPPLAWDPSGHSPFCVWRTSSSGRRSGQFWKRSTKEDFVGFPYADVQGIQPIMLAPGPEALKRVNWVLDADTKAFTMPWSTRGSSVSSSTVLRTSASCV